MPRRHGLHAPVMNAYRILVTGSRDWQEDGRLVVWWALDDAVAAVWDSEPHRKVVLIHGRAKGVDRLAERWASTFPEIEIERFPADWDRYGNAAGPIRNQQMVDAGADICIAFPMEGSKGTVDCMEKAKKAGIPVVEYPWDPVDPVNSTEE